MESQIQRKALLVISGDKTVTSYLDGVGHSSNVYEIHGSKYTLIGSHLRSHDYTSYSRVTKIGSEKRLLFNLTATSVSAIFATDESTNNLDVDLNVAMNGTIGLSDTSVESVESIIADKLPFLVSRARDRFHQYVCK